jgi:hypothetical protein
VLSSFIIFNTGRKRDGFVLKCTPPPILEKLNLVILLMERVVSQNSLTMPQEWCPFRAAEEGAGHCLCPWKCYLKREVIVVPQADLSQFGINPVCASFNLISAQMTGSSI